MNVAATRRFLALTKKQDFIPENQRRTSNLISVSLKDARYEA